MPFNGSGTFTVVNTFIPNTTILSSAVNANFTDIAAGLSDCLTRDGQAGMSAAFKAIAGSAAAPSITFTSDTKSGMYLVSSGNLGLTSNGAVAAVFNQFQVTQLQQAALAKLWCVIDTADVSTSTNINTIATAATGLINIGTSTNWPTNGYVLAGNEVMSFTLASANGLTINTRGDMGTTAVSHATGSTIAFLYTSVAQSTLLLPSRSTAARAAFPAPGEFGFNSGSLGLEFYNGSSWVNTSQPQIVPQGYLSPTAGTPIITGDAVSQTSIFYNPLNGNTLPVPTNGVFTLQTFTTSAIALSASQTTANIYDIYGFISSTNNQLTFGISPSWSAGSGGSVAAGSSTRGTGAGGTAITRLNGVYTNTVGMNLLNGANSYTIATASGILLGSIFIGATAGTVNLHRAYGQNRQWGVWNQFNRVPIYIKCGDSTANWTIGTGATFATANSTANSVSVFTGQAEEEIEITFVQQATGGNGTINKIAIGWNSLSTASGYTGASQVAVSAVTELLGLRAEYVQPPVLGFNIANCLESNTGPATQWFGTEANMLMTVRYRA